MLGAVRLIGISYQRGQGLFCSRSNIRGYIQQHRRLLLYRGVRRLVPASATATCRILKTSNTCREQYSSAMPQECAKTVVPRVSGALLESGKRSMIFIKSCRLRYVQKDDELQCLGYSHLDSFRSVTELSLSEWSAAIGRTGSFRLLRERLWLASTEASTIFRVTRFSIIHMPCSSFAGEISGPPTTPSVGLSLL